MLDQSGPGTPANGKPSPDSENLRNPVGGNLNQWISKDENTSTQPLVDQFKHNDPGKLQGIEKDPSLGLNLDEMMSGVQVGGLDGRTPDNGLGVDPHERSEMGLDENPQEGLVSNGKGGYKGPGSGFVKIMDEASSLSTPGALAPVATKVGVLAPGAAAVVGVVGAAGAGWAFGRQLNKVGEVVVDQLKEECDEVHEGGKFGEAESKPAEQESSESVPDPSKSVLFEKTDHGPKGEKRTEGSGNTAPTEEKEASGERSGASGGSGSQSAPPASISDPDNPEGTDPKHEKRINDQHGGLLNTN